MMPVMPLSVTIFGFISWFAADVRWHHGISLSSLCMTGNGNSGDESPHPPQSISTDNDPYSMKKRKPRRTKHSSSTRERSLAMGKDPLISLNMNLDYLAKSGQKNSAARAEELLMRIEKLYAEGYYEKRPDSVSYNSVMNAYVLSNEVSYKEVERLMTRMEKLCREGGNDALKPNVITFNTCKRPTTDNRIIFFALPYGSSPFLSCCNLF